MCTKATSILRLVSVVVLLIAMVGQVGVVRAATVVVQSVGVSHITPTPIDNDFTRIDNAIHAAANGDVIQLQGTFDFRETNAAASWALGHDGLTGTTDDYTVDVPANLNNVTLTAASLGAATIQGPGDMPTINLEAFLQFDGGPNQNWTISNLRIVDFDLSIGFFNGAGGTTAFNNTTITHNYIRIATDLNAVAAPADVNQNIGLHFSFGTNQKITFNTFDVPGDGVSDPSAPSDWWTYGVAGGANFSSNVVMQSNTSGGNVYEGLLIDHNIVQVLNAQSAQPARIIGFWENGHAHNSNITVSNNQFVNMAAGNDPTLNRQIAFRPSSHSSATTQVTYANNTVRGAGLAFGPMDVSAGVLPIQIPGSLFVNVNVDYRLGANENFNFVAQLSFDPASSQIASGGSTTVYINLSTVANLYGYQFEVNYDATRVNAVGAFVNSFFDTASPAFIPSGWNATCASGVCRFAASHVDPQVAVSGSGRLASITFTGVAPGTVSLTFSADILSDQDANVIAHTVGTGTLTVYGFATVSGQVRLQGRATPIDSGIVTLTDLDGNFAPFTVNFDAATGNFTANNVPVMPSGSNYQIDAAHSLYLGNRLTHLLNSGEVYSAATTTLKGGDANNDGMITVHDLACVGGAFGLPPAVCGSTGSSDITHDNMTNILDLVLVGSNYGRNTPQPW